MGKNMSKGVETIHVIGRGPQIELGQLYDARTGQFAAGYSAWDDADVRSKQVVKDCPNVELGFSSSLSESNQHVGLDIEGSIGLELGLFELSGSAKFFKESKKHAHTAQVTSHCTVTTRERRMPMEQLTNIKHSSALEDARFTHFVAEVREGGRAHLAFVVQTESAEEEQRVQGSLSAKVKAVVGAAGVAVGQEDQALCSACEVSLFCDYAAENAVHDFDSAVAEARRFPERLKGATNTLSAVLLPVSLLDSKISRVCREINAALLEDVQKELRRAHQLQLELQHCKAGLPAFPKIAEQIDKFATAYETCFRSFKAEVQRLLPLLHGAQDDQSQVLGDAVGVVRESSKVCEKYLAIKRAEQQNVTSLREFAVAKGLKDRVVCEQRAQASVVVFEVSLGTINNARKHPLQAALRRVSNGESSSGTDNEDSEEEDETGEWFQDDNELAYFRSQVELLVATAKFTRQWKNGCTHVFCIGASRPKKGKKTLRVGDVVATRPAGAPTKLQLARAPEQLRLDEATSSSLALHWQVSGGGEATPKCIVTLRLLDDEEGDGVVGTTEERTLSTTAGAVQKHVLDNLLAGTTYEVWVNMISDDGLVSPPSVPCLDKTLSRPSLIPPMVEQFHLNKQQWKAKGWDCDNTHLVLGKRTVSKYTDHKTGRVLVEIVEVAPLLDPQLPFPKEEACDVLLTTGASGHGKSTHLNAAINYLFVASRNDKKRLLLVDDRGKDGRHSVTSHVTVYKIRAHQGSRLKRGLWLIDSPGFGDTRGIEYDEHVAATYTKLFQLISRLSCVILVMKSTEERVDSRTKGVIAHIMRQFGKDVGNNILAVLTFCDAADPPAKKALQQLQVPVRAYIKTNNASFACSGGAPGDDAFGQLYWKLFVAGMKSMCLELAKLPPCTTKMSASVTQKRGFLNEKIALLQEAVTESVNRGANIVAQLNALSANVTAPPNAKIVTKVAQSKKVDLPSGVHVTNCHVCNHTCHYNCAYANDEDKKRCVAMTNGKCTKCQGRCHWTQHHNMKYHFECEEVEKVVMVEDVINEWDSNSKTIEGAVLGMIEGFVKEQEWILDLLTIMNQCQLELQDISLRDDPSALIDYIKGMIAAAKARGAHHEIEAMTRALRGFQFVRHLGNRKGADQREHKMISETMTMIRVALAKRSCMTPQERMEEQRSNLYNEIYDKLPYHLKQKAPPKLSPERDSWLRTVEPKFEKNLKAIMTLVPLLLQNGVFMVDYA